MVFGQLERLAKKFEATTGAPPLSRVVDSIEKLPDVKQLRMIKELLETAERVAKTAPDLDKVVALMGEINNLPIEKLDKLEKILRRIEGIIKSAPQDLLDFLAKLKEE